MILISVHNSIRCVNIALATKAIEKKLRNSKAVKNSVDGVRCGLNPERKTVNYYRVPNAVPLKFDPEVDLGNGTIITQRYNQCLKPSGKVLLDLDTHDRELSLKIFSLIQGMEKELGVLHVEFSINFGLHVTTRRISGLSIEQTILWWSNFLDYPIDMLTDLARACFLVPEEDVLFVDEELYYETVVEPIELGMDAVKLMLDDEILFDDDPDLEPMPETGSFDDPQTAVSESAISRGRSSTFSTGSCSGYRSTFPEDNSKELYHLIEIIEANHLDLTTYEPDWFKLGCICYSVLGAPEGREAFHRLSQFYPNYSRKETDRKYSRICRCGYDAYGIATLVHMMCQQMPLNQ